MKFPAHFNLTLDANDKADLAAARQSFIANMSGLNEAQQLDRAKVIAAGIRPADFYTRALAQQVVDAATARNDIKRLQGELQVVEEDLRQGGYRPKDPDWRGAALLRQEDLKRELENTHARLIGIAEDRLETAQRKAAVEFRQTRAKAKKTAALKEAVARHEARLEAEAIDRHAEGIARARRMTAGRSDPNAGESQ